MRTSMLEDEECCRMTMWIMLALVAEYMDSAGICSRRAQCHGKARGSRTYAAAMRVSRELRLRRCRARHILTSAHAATESPAVHSSADVTVLSGSTVEKRDSSNGDCAKYSVVDPNRKNEDAPV